MTGKNAYFRFTLLELLIVIAVIAILGALLMPIFRHAKDSAQSTICISRAKQTHFIYQMYADDFNGYLPCLENLKAAGQNSHGLQITAQNWLDDPAENYLGIIQLSQNPTMSLCCPLENDSTDIMTNYGLNYLISSNSNGSVRIFDLPVPDKTAILVENFGHLCYCCHITNPEKTFSKDSYAANRAPFFRHKNNAACSVVFLDAHGESRLKNQIPCAESYPNLPANVLKNTFFNSGIVNKNIASVNDL